MKTSLPSLYLFATLAALAPSAVATTFTVTNTDSGTGNGTLWRAVAEANAETGPGPQIIDATGVRGEIFLAQDLRPITNNVEIRGPGASKLRVYSNLSRRALFVNPTRHLTVDGLTFSWCGGALVFGGGGAIRNEGTLVVRDCVFSNCEAQGGGGAISTGGTSMSLVRCAFIGNQAPGESGAVECLSGLAEIDRCSFYGNAAGINGGAIGVFSATCNIKWCSISDNRAINAAGIYAVGVNNHNCTLENSIVAGNHSTSGEAEENLSQNVDRLKTNLVSGDPMLRVPSAYSGEVPYFLPHLESPAIDAAVATAGEVDMRGIQRPAGVADLGAVEVQVFRVSGPGGSAGDPGDTLHAAIMAAEDPGRPVLDYIDLLTLTQDIDLTDPLPELNRQAIIVGRPPNNPFRSQISGDGSFRIFNVGEDGHLTLEDLVVDRGYASDAGGAVLNHGTTVARRCTFSRHSAPRGGAIRNAASGWLDIGGCLFSDCSATDDSGAIENLNSPHCGIVNSTFIDNSAGRNGGAIAGFNVSSNMRIDHCTFCRNTAGSQGDDVYVFNSYAEVTRSALLDCGLPAPADNLYNDGGSLDEEQNFIDAGDGGLDGDTPLPGSPLLNGVDPAVNISIGGIPGDQYQIDRMGNRRGHLGRRDIGAIEFYQDPYLAWVSRNFPSNSINAPRHWLALRGDDPDRDGLSNFFELIFGGDPHRPDRHLGPRMVANSPADGGGYSFEYRDTRLLDHRSESSTDLQTWTGTLFTVTVQLDSDGIARWHSAPFNPTGGQQFFRLVPDTGADDCLSMPYSYVGDPGNPPDPASGLGRVDQSYLIGSYEVTNREYAAFLNCVDRDGTNALELYNDSMPPIGISLQSSHPAGRKYVITDDKDRFPVRRVNWYSALRFCNWMSSGNTEFGAYPLEGGSPIPGNAGTIARHVDAKVALPTLDEWYKAAFYLGSGSDYALYPTGATVEGMINNIVNLDQYSAIYERDEPTHVGANILAASHYGTFDQGGNVHEWTQRAVAPDLAEFAGGTYNSPETELRSSFSGASLNALPQEGHHDRIGFRVVRLE